MNKLKRWDNMFNICMTILIILSVAQLIINIVILIGGK